MLPSGRQRKGGEGGLSVTLKREKNIPHGGKTMVFTIGKKTGGLP